MTASKAPSPWFNFLLAVLVAVVSLAGWGFSGNYASSAQMTAIEIKAVTHDEKIQAQERRIDAHDRTLETMAKQIDDIHKVLIENRASNNGR